MTRVLFVDDEPHVLDSLRDALRSHRHEWAMAFANGPDAALAELDRHEFDVVVSDMRMPGIDGADLLAMVRSRQPSTVRIVLSGYAEVDVVMRAAAVAHRFLAKPCDTAELTRVVERSCAIAELAAREQGRRAAARASELPCIPAVYHRLAAALSRPETTVEEVVALVEQDVAVSARVLQLANSAFFVRAPPIAKVDEAVVRLGLGTMKALVLSAGALAAFEPVPPIEGFSIEEIRRRGAAVAHVARHILPAGQARDDAVAAAMLHEVGLLVLAVEEPEALAGGARGVSHAEVGAHLLDLWGLPHAIVEAVAYHDRPGAVPDPRLDAVTAVAIAGALVREAAGEPPSPALEPELVDRLGIAGRLPEWRRVAAATVGAWYSS